TFVGDDASNACICARVVASDSFDGFGTNARSLARPSPSRSANTAAETKPNRRPVRAAAAADDTREDRPRPRPKKRKRPRDLEPVLTDEERAQARRDRNLASFEWYVPAGILGVGLVMCVVGGVKAGGAVGLVTTIGVLVIGLAVTIPLSVVALMALGVLAGINYGRFGPAVLKLAAIGSVAQGIMLMGSAVLGLPFFLFLPVSGLVTLILFMTQFELEYGEANASVGAINLLNFLANLMILAVLAGATSKSGKGADEYRDDGDRGDTPALVDTDDDLPPREARQDPGRGKGQPAKGKGRARPVDQDEGMDDE
ncbi:MAG: hypothetical protein K2X82_18810, partial [Gemmataceae bacterium]|nr:hypothetical protein [Gemmataceae bacterium]